MDDPHQHGHFENLVLHGNQVPVVEREGEVGEGHELSPLEEECLLGEGQGKGEGKDRAEVVEETSEQENKLGFH